MFDQSSIDRSVREFVVAGSGAPCLPGDVALPDRFSELHSVALLEGERQLGTPSTGYAPRGGSVAEADLYLYTSGGWSQRVSYPVFFEDASGFVWRWEPGLHDDSIHAEAFFGGFNAVEGVRAGRATVNSLDEIPAIVSVWPSFPRSDSITGFHGEVHPARLGSDPTSTYVSWHDVVLDYRVRWHGDASSSLEAALAFKSYAESGDLPDGFAYAFCSDVVPVREEVPDARSVVELSLSVSLRRELELEDVPAEVAGDIRLFVG